MKMVRRKPKTIGLIGTVTKDHIAFESDLTLNRTGIGGLVYQAAVLCRMGHKVRLITQIGEDLLPEFKAATRGWNNLRTESVYSVPGPGNQVYLFYPVSGERKEILASVVPSLKVNQILPFLSNLDLLVLILNSGFDISLKDWKDSLKKTTCPVWLDLHSLMVAKKIGLPRDYVPFPQWQDWVTGVTYLQANKQEVASALGDPEKPCEDDDILAFGQAAFRREVNAVFVTLGREGVMVLTPGYSQLIQAVSAERVVDTTGCGDVFCAAAVDALSKGDNCFASAEAGVRLAAKAAETAGIEEVYSLTSLK